MFPQKPLQHDAYLHACEDAVLFAKPAALEQLLLFTHFLVAPNQLKPLASSPNTKLQQSFSIALLQLVCAQRSRKCFQLVWDHFSRQVLQDASSQDPITLDLAQLEYDLLAVTCSREFDARDWHPIAAPAKHSEYVQDCFAVYDCVRNLRKQLVPVETSSDSDVMALSALVDSDKPTDSALASESDLSDLKIMLAAALCVRRSSSSQAHADVRFQPFTVLWCHCDICIWLACVLLLCSPSCLLLPRLVKSAW